MPQLLLKGKLIGNIKGVLFDKDGTLSNSEEYLLILAKARINSSLKKFNELKKSTKQLFQLEKLLLTIYGLSTKGLDPKGLLAIASREQNLISTATVFSILGESWPISLSLAQEIFIAADSDTTLINTEFSEQRTIISGAKAFLLSLQKAKVKAGLITNDSKLGAKEFIEKNNVEKIFKHLWTADNFPSKPDPKSVIDICSEMEISPSECALISDADTDLQMAAQSKIGVIIGFTGGWRIQPNLHQGNFLINHWNELEIHKTP